MFQTFEREAQFKTDVNKNSHIYQNMWVQWQRYAQISNIDYEISRCGRVFTLKNFLQMNRQMKKYKWEGLEGLECKSFCSHGGGLCCL